MSTEELDYWQSTLDRWSEEARQLMAPAPKGSRPDPLHAVKYVMGGALAGLSKRLQDELNRVRQK